MTCSDGLGGGKGKDSGGKKGDAPSGGAVNDLLDFLLGN